MWTKCSDRVNSGLLPSQQRVGRVVSRFQFILFGNTTEIWLQIGSLLKVIVGRASMCYDYDCNIPTTYNGQLD